MVRIPRAGSGQLQSLAVALTEHPSGQPPQPDLTLVEPSYNAMMTGIRATKISHWNCVFCIVVMLFSSGCATIGYYFQSASGQLELLSKRRPIDQVLLDPTVPAATKRRLHLITDVRRFASQELGLPDNASYSSYADLGRDFSVWAVFAAPELSLEPIEFCFPIIGCLHYRGYFSQAHAVKFSQGLVGAGHDVFIGGVAAYSTLGWFDDPVVSPMLRWGDPRLIKVIFHELAHQVIYIPDDTGFNEAFATTVGEVGFERWLEQSGNAEMRTRYRLSQKQNREFINLILAGKERLLELYQSTRSSSEQRAEKAKIFAAIRNDYQEFKLVWKDEASYDEWMATDLNNAKIASVVTYHHYVDAFRALLARSNDDLNAFYGLVAALGELAPPARAACLELLANTPDQAPIPQAAGQIGTICPV